MTLLVDISTAGLEQIQRATLTQLFHGLNDTLVLVQAAWDPSDEQLDELRGLDYVPTVLEPVASENFYEGFRPSLISAPITNYPNVAVMAYTATPGPGTELYDHQEKYRLSLVVEGMVKASPDEGEEACNRRAQRMAEAINAVITADATLGGTVSGLDATPTIRIAELFTRKEKSNYGDHWFWQGCRLEYAVRKEAVIGQSHGQSFRPYLDIDQE